MDQLYARRKYREKYREIYKSVVDREYHEDEVYTKVENRNSFIIEGTLSLEKPPHYIYCGSINNASGAKKIAIERTTSIFAKDILESEMMKELDVDSLYFVIRSLHKEGILTFQQDYQNNELLMSAVIMRYISIIPKLIKLDNLQNIQNVLIYSIQQEDLPLLNTLVEAMKLNGITLYAYGLARYTVNNKNVDILEFLIENNMSYDQLDMKIAKEKNNKKMLNLLLEKSPYLDESLKQAFSDCDFELAKAIIKTNRIDVAKDDTFIKDAVGKTRDVELVKMLIDAGANVNAKYDAIDAMKYRACRPLEAGIEDFGDVLTKAVIEEKFEIAELLKKAGAKERT